MTFFVDHAPRRLLARGFLEPADIVGGGLEVVVVSRRHLSLRVRRSSGAPIFVKQVDSSVPGSRRTLAIEGRFYQFCQQERRAEALRRYLPPLVDFDEREGIVVLAWLDRVASLWTAYRRHHRLELPRAPLRALGRGLGLLHRVFGESALFTDPRLDGLPDRPPSSLTFHRPEPAVLRRLSRAQWELMRVLQQDAEIGRGLEAAAASWRMETLIHGDLRGANVLVSKDEGSGSLVRLVDWEFARHGDRAWDLAGVLADALVFWVDGMSHEVDRTPAQRARSALYPLESIQPALRSLWRAYVAGSDVSPARTGALLRRAVPFAAARLIQFAWEYSAHRRELSARAVLLLQLAANVLARPGQSASALFGLTETEADRET